MGVADGGDRHPSYLQVLAEVLQGVRGL